MRLYDYPLSGNGYKVRLLLAHLRAPYDYVTVDILAGEARTPAFRTKNPIGKIPVLELDDGRMLPESNAILFWLAQGTAYWPEGPFAQAEVLRWLFFEQQSHMPNVGGARYWLAIDRSEPTPYRRERVREMQARGAEALGVMNAHLAERDFLVGGRCSIADIALYAYTHVAPEGGIELHPFPALCRWLERVAAQPGHVPMPR